VTDPLDIARRFAQALDREDYAAAASCLAPDCEYAIRGRVLRGPEAIVASYREAGEWGAGRLDGIRFESSVRAGDAGGAVVTFVDHLEHRGERHTHRCEQRLEFEATGLVRRIEHVDLPGEREALEGFFARAGIASKGSERGGPAAD
jgi:ketosteroid isomerase-like protein